MSLFSLENILIKENTNNDIYNINEMTSTVDNENYSFMQESYRFILDYTKEFNEANKTFYKNITESYGDQQIITESFSDFFSKAKEIIKKFLEFIKRIFREFSVKLHSLFKSEKYLTKNKNEFAKFNSDDEFEYKGYMFTHLYNNSIPLSDACDAFYGNDNQLTSVGKTDFQDMSIANIKKYSDEADYESENHSGSFTGTADAAKKNKEASVKAYVNAKYKELEEKLEDYYDWFRGHVIGKGTISSSDYGDKLRELFRNDDSEPVDITIDSSFVNEAWTRFDGYKKLIKSIEETRKNIEKDYTKLKDALDKSVKYEKEGNGIFFKFDAASTYNYANNNIAIFGTEVNSDNKFDVYSTDVVNKIDMYIKAKINQVQQMSTIHTMAFTAKIQAAKDCFVQDKKILYKALAKIKAHHKDYINS